MLAPNMNSSAHNLLIQVQTAPLNIRNSRRTGLLSGRRHHIAEAMHQPRTTVLAKQTIHIAIGDRVPCVASHEVRDGCRELKIGEDGGYAECGGALVLAFCAVAYVYPEGFVERCFK